MIYTMNEAAKQLRMSRRWLQDWLRDHPLDAKGRPYYAPLGRCKTFDDDDLLRIRETAREEERIRLSPSRRVSARRASPPATPPERDTATLVELRALLNVPRRKKREGQ